MPRAKGARSSAAIFPLTPAGTGNPFSPFYLLFSLSFSPQTFGLVEMEAKPSHGTISVVFKKKCFCTIFLFFFVLFFSRQCFFA